MPSDFMAMAEESGTVHAIGLWVLEHALRDLRGWRAEGTTFKLAVNVSARQLMQQELVEEVQRLLTQNEVPPGELRLEISEPTLMTDSEEVHRQLRALKALGVEIAIDNFGTGYSSLGLVRGLPISVVKIDRSLVSSCPSKRECAAIVQAASAMSRVMGIRVVAEGVETEEQRRMMITLGCDGAQGFLFAKPIEPKRVPRLMHEKPTVPLASD
jgi:EAL domain-containing protein (putative c-di-GMP-specific phosphodiesterase class I)